MAANPVTLDTGGVEPLYTASSNAKPSNAKDAATQFEGLLIAEMLRSAHEASPGGLDGDDEDSQSSTLFDLAGEQFAQMIAKQGGFGIARVVTSGLAGK
jgi:Rod binding domain-containing protein